MLTSLRNLGKFVKVPDLRNRVMFTLGIIALYQIGANITVPGVDFHRVQILEQQAQAGGILGFLDLFSGGGLTRIAVFGLGIMPYITSSIIIQLLTTVIPKFMEWRDQGAVGQKKLTQATRYLTVILALLQSTGLVYAFHKGLFGLGGAGSQNLDLIPDFTLPRVALIVLTLTAGTAFVMWLGENITQRGIGQGMSILIFANVVAGIPYGGGAVLAQGGALKFSVLIVVSLALLVAIVFVEQGQRRIPVTFARRVVGRRMYGGQSTYIPMKVNQAGVIPVIFASSILYIPVLLSNIIPVSWFRNFVNNNLLQPTHLLYILPYFFLIVIFTFFYVQVTFDPYQQADIIRKQGGYIPGIRPGPSTERYLSRILNRITLPGSLFLATVAVVPSLLLALWGIDQYPFAGVTLLIAVGVSLETLKQVDSQLMMRNYEGFLQ
ncbi:MAG: preprotein translocase subunit SecY [Actinobacteria bacterium]|nr:preprotein translocase subunit SecY [Actinomycetota bacterium]